MFPPRAAASEDTQRQKAHVKMTSNRRHVLLDPGQWAGINNLQATLSQERVITHCSFLQSIDAAAALRIDQHRGWRKLLPTERNFQNMRCMHSRGEASTRSMGRLDRVRQKGEVHPGASRGVNSEFKWKDSLLSVSVLNTNLHFKRVSLAGPLQCKTLHCLWLEKHQRNVRLIMMLICSNSLGLFVA